MLTELRISNFALIDQLHLEFSDGFQVLTGETGAGKSLLIDALMLLLGGRASGDLIRTGAEDAILEGSFFVSSKGVTTRLQEWGIPIDANQELLLRRILSKSGRSRMFVNGAMVPLQQMQELGEMLVDFHGQHAQQSLLSARVQLELVDAFGGHLDVRNQYAGLFQEWKNLMLEQEATIRQSRERKEREDFLRFQLDELVKAQLKTGEEAELLAEYRRVKNGSALVGLAKEAYAVLHQGDRSLLTQLHLLKKSLQALGEMDPQTKEWSETVEGAMMSLEELAHAIRAYREGCDHDPLILERLDERLATIQRLKKKYQETEQGLITKQAGLSAELEFFTTLETRLEELDQAVRSTYTQVQKLAETLSVSRKQVALKLQKRMAMELASLRMKGTEFRIRVSRMVGAAELGTMGQDQVEFGFCANPGESVQPLSRVASGGELSRLMLALKTVLAKVDKVPVLIFDEVDAGVGGQVAAVMGERLQALGKSHQVFCITHLPQIAALANGHFKVEKQVVSDRTLTRVRRLNQEDRKEEIARMLAGTTVTPTVRKAAAEMLKGQP